MPRGTLDQSAVLDAAGRLADRRGLPGLTMVTLAAELNIRTPSLYSHFDGLAAVEDGLTLRGLEGLLAAARDDSAGLAGGASLAALARSHRAYARSHPGLYAATLRHAEDRSAEIRAAAAAYLKLVTAILRGYGLAGDPALHAARCLHAALRGFVTLELKGGMGLAIDADESFEVLLLVLTAGLSDWSGRSPRT